MLSDLVFNLIGKAEKFMKDMAVQSKCVSVNIDEKTKFYLGVRRHIDNEYPYTEYCDSDIYLHRSGLHIPMIFAENNGKIQDIRTGYNVIVGRGYNEALQNHDWSKARSLVEGDYIFVDFVEPITQEEAAEILRQDERHINDYRESMQKEIVWTRKYVYKTIADGQEEETYKSTTRPLDEIKKHVK